MRTPMRPALIATILALVAAAAIVWSTMRQAGPSCEVCITYRGSTQCRTAAGATREDAVRVATDNACAFISSGMAEGIQCGNTPPDSVRCDE